MLENQGENPFRVFCVMNVDFFGKKAKFIVHASFELETSKYSFSCPLGLKNFHFAKCHAGEAKMPFMTANSVVEIPC